MNIKNNVSLSVSEAVELLAKIADSLERNREFAFDLKGQEVSIEAGDVMNAVLSIKPKEFSIVFNWDEAEVEETQEFYEPPQMIKEVNLPEDKPKQRTPQIRVEGQTMSTPLPRRALPDRMPLNTTTLPYDAGYWASAFTSSNESQWTLLQIDSELENKKWASDDQITSLSDLTPASAKPKTKRNRIGDDDDLFSELDNLDEKPKKVQRQTSSSSNDVEKVEIPDHRSAVPAANVQSIPSPAAKRTATNVPDSSPPKASAGGIPKPGVKSTEWKEPPRVEQSQDNWVKPSQVLKNKEKQGSDPKSSIPSPGASKSKEGQSSKKNTIPSPSANRSSSTSNKGEGVSEWREPSREDNVTDDDWIKPSEFLKKSKQEKSKDAINRPPPTAPDKKKSDDDDDKRKGWASWD